MSHNSSKRISDLQKTGWPENGLEPVLNCPACNSTQKITLYKGLTDQVFFCAPGTWTLRRCQDCNSAFLDPRPSADTIHLAYETYYTHKASTNISTNDLTPIRRFIRASANSYRNQRYGSNLHPASSFGRVLIQALPRYRRKLDIELRYLPYLPKNARVLDVGFGNGEFLETAQLIGWNVAGADPDPVAVKIARDRGLEVRQGGIEAFSDQTETFHAITLSHVIEHVHNPYETLKQAFLLLKPGGCLYLDTPNIEALGHEEFGRYWRGLEVPRHLTIFTWPSLQKLLRLSGFERIDRHCRPDIYLNIASKSRAIQEAKNPYRNQKRTPRDWVMSFLSAIKTRTDNRYSEFITLTAHKPE